MKMDQNTTQTSTVLLRDTTGVDTTETNSLCCAAAGIIAPLSATAEALIPHKKLRGAALTDATLNAQERTLAQPALGYKSPLHDLETAQQQAVKVAFIDERAEFEREFPVPEGVQYCRQRGTYIKAPGASTSDNFGREHYAYRAGFAAWMRRAWKQSTLDAQLISCSNSRSSEQEVSA
jgi:hypothetical protein